MSAEVRTAFDAAAVAAQGDLKRREPAVEASDDCVEDRPRDAKRARRQEEEEAGMPACAPFSLTGVEEGQDVAPPCAPAPAFSLPPYAYDADLEALAEPRGPRPLAVVEDVVELIASDAACREAVCSALCRLATLVLAGGAKVQELVVQSTCVLQRLPALLACPGLELACCRVVWSLAGRNPVLTKVMVAEHPGVVDALVAAVQGCGEGKVATAAMWALASLLPAATVATRRRMFADHGLVAALCAYVGSWCEETVAAAVRALGDLTLNLEGDVAKLFTTRGDAFLHSVVQAAVRVPLAQKAFVCKLVTQVLGSAGDGDMRRVAVDAGLGESLLDMVKQGEDDRKLADLQNRALCAMGTLAQSVPHYQDEVRLRDGGHFTRVVMTALRSNEGEDVVSALIALIGLCKGNVENCDLFGAMGACDAVAAHIMDRKMTARVLESALVALRVLATPSASNQAVVSKNGALALRVVQVLDMDASPRLQSCAAFLVRVLVTQNAERQMQWTGHGAVSRLSQVARSRDPQARDHALAALLTIMDNNDLVCRMAVAVGDLDVTLTSVLTDAHHQMSSIMCSVQLLWVMSGKDGAFDHSLKASTALLDALCLLAHPDLQKYVRCANPNVGRVSQLCKALLSRLLNREELDEVRKRAYAAALDATLALPGGIQPLDPVPEGFTCHVCMEGDTESCVVALPCGQDVQHTYHEQCLRAWASHGASTCPQCRSDFLKPLFAATYK